MFSRPRAFSSTQRMERSSSMIQTGFMPPGRPKAAKCLRAQRAVVHVSFIIPSFFCVSGSISEKQVRPGRDVTSMVPPCCWMKLWAIVRPRPLPFSRPETSG
jgi:hypothetical protein